MSYRNIINIVKPADYIISGTFPNGQAYSTTMAYPPAPTPSTYEEETNSSAFFRMPVVSRPFNKLKKEGKILMAPHKVINEEIQNFLVSFPQWFVTIRRPHWFYQPAGQPVYCYYDPGQTNLLTTWTEQGDFRYWSNVRGYKPQELDSLPDILSAVRSTQSSAVASFKGGYDLLTELAESREAIKFFGDSAKGFIGIMDRLFEDEPSLRKAVKGRYNAQRLLRSADRGLRALGSKWMAYRYAIMPLFYSFRDVKELIANEGLLFKTYRAKEEFKLEASSMPSGHNSGIFLTRSGRVDVKSTVKAGYSKEGLQSFVANQVQFNPLATAYELIPLSFVFDWIVNMGDFIVSHSSTDFSEQSSMCTAIRTSLIETWTLSRDSEAYVELIVGGAGNPCIPSPTVLKYSQIMNNSEILRTRVVNNYDRFLFTDRDVSLSLNSSMMNWKRYVDATVLSYQPIKKLLKRVLK